MEAHFREAGTPERFEEWRAKNGIYRKAEDGLEDEWTDSYVAWRASGNDPKVYYWLIENKTLTEVAEVFAMIRTDAYLEEEHIPKT